MNGALACHHEDPGSVTTDLNWDSLCTKCHPSRFFLFSLANLHSAQTPYSFIIAPRGVWWPWPSSTFSYPRSWVRAGPAVNAVRFICKVAVKGTTLVECLRAVGPVPWTCVYNRRAIHASHQSVLSQGRCSRNHSAPVHHALTDIQPACLIVSHVLR